jgi:rhodanese-related sulfurtransferase
VAAKYIKEGYQKVGVLDGGVDAWKQAGYPVSKDM